MKNIHILPTDKPSRLSKQLDNPLVLYKQFIENRKFGRWSINQHIYITNDEEIKEGDWVYCTERKLFGKVVEIQLAKQILDTSMLYFEINDEEIWCKLFNCKKIILTTDQDLIGVQTIDDEFIQWFVKNPNCEEVKLRPLGLSGMNGFIKDWKIIIPKEKPKQETLEEFAERISKGNGSDNWKEIMEGIIEGAKWEQKRSYNNEEVLELLQKRTNYVLNLNSILTDVRQWFEQFKKK